MSPLTLFAVLILLSVAGYYFGKRRAFALDGGPGATVKLHSRPTYHGALAALWCGIPAVLVFAAWLLCETQIITYLVIAGLPDAVRGCRRTG
jgi:phosphate transport system permease protein